MKWVALFAIAASLAGCAAPATNEVLSNRAMPPRVFGPPTAPDYDSPPRLIGGPSPTYPAGQWMAGKGGSATVEFVIGENGAARDIRIVEASQEIFGTHLLLAVREWRFQPASRQGRPVPVRVRQAFTFNSE